MTLTPHSHGTPDTLSLMNHTNHKLYDNLAWLWPLLSPPGDYQDEAKGVHQLICKRLGKPVTNSQGEHDITNERTLLELGSGGGHMLLHLQQWYDVTGSDLSAPMLELSASLNPLVTHYQADMRTLRLEETFDVVLIHDALGYMVSRADLAAAIATAHLHLKPDGVLVLLPDEIHETFCDQQTASDSIASPDGKEITLVSHAAFGRDETSFAESSDDKTSHDEFSDDEPGENESTYDLTMLFLIREDGNLRIEEDRHRCGLFSKKTWREVLTQCGFEKISMSKETAWRGSPVIVAQKCSK